MIRLFTLLAALGAALLSPLDAGHGAAAPDWPAADPAQSGFAPDLGETLDAVAGTPAFANLHSVVVARRGALVLERYFAGSDERWGTPLGRVEFGPGVLHDLRSVSKSIVSLLYGIALADGRVPALDDRLLDQFPAYADLAGDPRRDALTVAHALTMMLGTEWNEQLPYTDPRNSEIAMERAPDRYRYVLSRPAVAEPGTTWTYNGGATAVLARLISRGTGKPLLDYAREKLFAPLGIADVEWVNGSNGEAAAASGLRLRPRDLARVGQLVLDGGRHGDAQLVPADWLEDSFTPRAAAFDGLDYGYHWWLGTLRGSGKPWIAAFGNGGQRLVIVPSLELVVAITAGNYNQPDDWKLPVAVMSQVVMPALRE